MATIERSSGKCFLNSRVSNIVSVTFILNSVFDSVFERDNINPLISASFRHFHFIKPVLSQKISAEVFEIMTIYRVYGFMK